MKGWKTVTFGLFMIVVPPALNYLGGIDWQSLGISPAESAVIGAVIIALRAVTSTPIGKAAGFLAILPALGLAGVLAGCTGGAKQTGIDLAQDAGAGIVRNLSAADLQKLKDTCLAAAPAVVAAADPAMPKPVKDVAVYPYAFCAQLISGSAGNADQSSLTWLPKVLAMTDDAAQVAGVVLPIALKALPLVAGLL